MLVIHLKDSIAMNYAKRERERALTAASEKAFTSTSYEYVKKKIKKLGLEDMVIPVKGFFQDTLPHLRSKLCFALVDCDLKESTIFCAETIWQNLVTKGRIVFDDYTCREFQGARLGIEFFVNKHKTQFAGHGLMNRLYYVVKK